MEQLLEQTIPKGLLRDQWRLEPLPGTGDRRLPTRSREETIQLQSESQVHVVVDTGVQTERLEEMEEVHCMREEVEAFYKACNLPNAPDDLDEFGDDEGFGDDELLFYEWLTVET